MALQALEAKGDAPSCDGVQSGIGPERVFQQSNVESDAVVSPQSAGARKVSAAQESAYRAVSLPAAARSAGVREIAKNWECKLLEGRVVADKLLQERDDPRCSCCILSRLAQATKIEQRVDSWVLEFLRAGESRYEWRDAYKASTVRTAANLPDTGVARIRASISMTPALCKASRVAVTIETFLIDLSTPTSDSDSRSLTAETKPDEEIIEISVLDKLGRVWPRKRDSTHAR